MAKRKPTPEEVNRDKLVKSLKPHPHAGDMSPEQREEFEDMQWRAEHKAIDFKYGLLNPKKLLIRFVQYLTLFLVLSYFIDEADRAKSHRELDEELSHRKPYVNPYRDDGWRPTQTLQIPTNGVTRTKQKSEVVIKSVAHGKYPDEYTIEYKSYEPVKVEVSPEDYLDQIDQEDILDYMDGNID